MKKMLRSLSLVIVFMFVAGFMVMTSATGAKKIVVGFSQIGAESAWRTAETNSIKAAAGPAGVTLKFADGMQKQENQIKSIRAFIAQKVDVIALAPVVDSGWDAVLKEAKKAKIPVILVDRSIKTSDPSLYATYIGSDFFLEAVNACKLLAAAMGEKGNVVELQGTVGSSAAVERGKGFAAELKNHPNIKVIKSQSGNFTRAEGQQVMEAFLKSDGDNIQGLYAHNDDMALGAIQAMEAAGKKPGVDIKIVSVDGVRDMFVALAAGKANATVECNPLLGPQIFKAAKDLKAGKSIPKWIKSQETFYKANQAAAALPSRKY
jgi:galactofuranose transport system substrate-binding protein